MGATPKGRADLDGKGRYCYHTRWEGQKPGTGWAIAQVDAGRGVNLEDSWGGGGKAEEEGAAETMLGEIWPSAVVSEARAISWLNASFWQCTLTSRGLYRRLTGLQGRVQGKARHGWKSPPSPQLRRKSSQITCCLLFD